MVFHNVKQHPIVWWVFLCCLQYSRTSSSSTMARHCTIVGGWWNGSCFASCVPLRRKCCDSNHCNYRARILVRRVVRSFLVVSFSLCRKKDRVNRQGALSFVLEWREGEQCSVIHTFVEVKATIQSHSYPSKVCVRVKDQPLRVSSINRLIDLIDSKLILKHQITIDGREQHSCCHTSKSAICSRFCESHAWLNRAWRVKRRGHRRRATIVHAPSRPFGTTRRSCIKVEMMSIVRSESVTDSPWPKQDFVNSTVVWSWFSIRRHNGAQA